MHTTMVGLLYLVIAWSFHAGTIDPFNHLIGGGDGFIQGVASKTFATSFSPWNPYVQSGKFVFADVLYQSFYPPNLIILSIFPNVLGFNLFLLLHYALAGLFSYLYLGVLRLTSYSAFVGGLVFMVCGFLTAHKGHEYIVCAAAWLPLTLYFVHRYAARLRVLDLGYAATPTALSILAGFPQITLYSTLLVIAYIPFCLAGSPLLQSWKAKIVHIVFSLAAILGMGCLLGSLALFPVASSLSQLTRERITYAAFTSDNFPPWQLLTFLVPNLFGGVNRHVAAYAPETTVFVAEVYAYVGIMPLILVLVGLFAWRRVRREIKFWSSIAVIGLLVSFGGATPIYLLLFHLPIYNLFRVPARHLFEVCLALSVMAAIGLDYLIAKARREILACAVLLRRAFVLICLAMGLTFLIAIVFRLLAKDRLSRFLSIPDSFPLNYCYTFGAVKSAIIQNLSWNSPTLITPLIFLILTGTALFSLFQSRWRFTALMAIPILVVSDTFFASRLMYDNPSTKLLYQQQGRTELEFLRAKQFDSVHYRLFPVDFDVGIVARLTSTYHLPLVYPYPLLNMFNNLSVINDYGPFWLKRYQAVTGFSAGGGMPVANLQNYKMLSLLGVRYLMVLSAESRQAIESVRRPPHANEGEIEAFTPAAVTSNGITIFENPSVLPRFRFISKVTPALDLNDALSLMKRPDFNPAEEAVVEGLNGETQMSTGRITSEQLETTRLRWEVEASGRSLFVVADSFFPGWIATVDGRPTQIYAVYGCVRGILIETSGPHHIEMRFVPPGLGLGVTCTAGGLLLLGILWFGDRTGRLNRLSIERFFRLSHPRYRAGDV